MKTISLKDLREIKNSGHKIFDTDGNEVSADFILIVSQIEELKKYTEELKFLRETHKLMSDLPQKMANMMADIQKTNKDLLDALRNQKDPILEVKPDVKPEIKLEPKVSVEQQPPKKWKHEVTNMTRTGRISEIVSTPID